jgi:hypothetical protein
VACCASITKPRVTIRELVGQMSGDWSKRGYELSLGIGIAQGYATIFFMPRHVARYIGRCGA